MSTKPSSTLEKILEGLPESDLRNKEQYIIDEAEQSLLDYSLSVITSRALPDLKDGLKPVHRRILYAAYEEKMFSDSRFKKSATLVGAVMGGYHPHGDSSIYGALVRMSQDFNMRYPLLEGQGNFGSIDGDAPAAMRYTEVKMSKLGELFLEGIKEDAVDFSPNYDGSKQEPTVLPVIAPSILLNGGEGIAVGMASRIPSHNLQETCDAVIALIDNPSMKNEDFLRYMKGPDFPTGGEILNYKGVERYFLSGRGTFRIRARAEKNEAKSQIIIKEIPFGVKKSDLIKQIAKLASKDEKAKHRTVSAFQRFIANIRDESNLKEGIRLVIECQRGTDLDVILNNLYKYTSLQKSYTANLTLLSNGEPKELSVGEILKRYLDHQLHMLVRKTRYNLDKLNARIHILEGRKAVVSDLHTVVEIISNEEEPERIIQETYSLSDIQVKDIFDLPLRQLKKIEFQKLVNELEDKIRSRQEHEEILALESKQKEIIKGQLRELSEGYSSDPRRTKISTYGDGSIRELDLFSRETLVVNITKKHFISALPLKDFKTRNRGTTGSKTSDGSTKDLIVELVVTSSHNELMLFSNLGRVYKIERIFDIKVSEEKGKWSKKPISIRNLLNYAGSLFQEGEKIIQMVSLSREEYDQDSYIFFATEKGMIKRTHISQFKSVRKNGKLAIKLNPDDELKSVIRVDEESEVILASTAGLVVRFGVGDKDKKGRLYLRPLSRSARGVKGINLKDSSGAIRYSLISASSTYQLKPVEVDEEITDEKNLPPYVLSISDGGKGKLTGIREFRKTKRGAKGVRAYQSGEKQGTMIACTLVAGNEEILLMTNKSDIARIKTTPKIRGHAETGKAINVQGRAAQGVQLMGIDKHEKEKLVYCTKYEYIDSEEEQVSEPLK
ncbi:DNA gyrase subunit A [Candidatus Mycoplasma haematolamae str. Purdue]|uniref:DNA topoisomerase (ATP-hydrolyzing) n=1 Tax=Mycoplasma haematolamae (strain Purdue) TaxID=1212765 RepID=I7CIC9_MYCHA|nr:DNA topoisomerase (ATP-hydrolyzing) [Candidatus Mycoplasma haematolamae]AFO51604.1 DNA gyrase subunit A [Candidatus Mycoplasma haematolamae str. Purdue]